MKINLQKSKILAKTLIYRGGLFAFLAVILTAYIDLSIREEDKRERMAESVAGIHSSLVGKKIEGLNTAMGEYLNLIHEFAPYSNSEKVSEKEREEKLGKIKVKKAEVLKYIFAIDRLEPGFRGRSKIRSFHKEIDYIYHQLSVEKPTYIEIKKKYLPAVMKAYKNILKPLGEVSICLAKKDLKLVDDYMDERESKLAKVFSLIVDLFEMTDDTNTENCGPKEKSR
uniref:Uncharacterized protein n=1 Tax=Candidatus Kentrum sp. TUN TaxID=2126343 RepID=A0A450ZYZ3_9GAMM|nr:MAG: hypothetical protein BECKTUN1418D_GA0071000_10945 [Candidatus Kentron sp. TUN]